jgi:hypothetical protein
MLNPFLASNSGNAEPITAPSPIKNEPYKTHLAYVKERRSDAEGAKILDEALRKLRGDD